MSARRTRGRPGCLGVWCGDVGTACPQGHADSESFNASLREECLNVHGVEDLTDARAKMQAWKQEYNED